MKFGDTSAKAIVMASRCTSNRSQVVVLPNAAAAIHFERFRLESDFSKSAALPAAGVSLFGRIGP
jgi:hypothetical protein